jgi:3-hydroxyacyl-[acyl-carrier-protein] dehydratase
LEATLIAMRFELLDQVLEAGPERVVAIKRVSLAEEYLQDHFPGFPILPGVMMLETMVQAARRALIERDPGLSRHVLGEVRALKYGAMVRPGEAIRVEATLSGEPSPGVFAFRGVATLVPGEGSEAAGGARTAASGRFLMRAQSPLAAPARVGAASGGS